jgi:hypothetical protein
MLKDSFRRGERVELATNKVTFWGTQNDTVRSNQEMILGHYLSSSQPTPTKSRIKIKVIEFWRRLKHQSPYRLLGLQNLLTSTAYLGCLYLYFKL